jgi:diaminohydroxyphosphoribosylaminopyrimidine deaminase/5-amino-6-(5-phosphoribosylamino)uracil reductase
MVGADRRNLCLWRQLAPALQGLFWLVEQVQNDEYWMKAAIRIAELGRGQTSPNPLVGALVVRDCEIVGQGVHLRAGTPHAEVHALRMAGEQAKGATVYVTLEPCSHFGRTPPCCDALIAAGVKRVVAAMADPNPAVSGQGFAKLRAAGIEVTVGVCADEAARQNEEYLHWRRTGRPFVIWKVAATLDGYIATRTGHSQYVTGEAARAEVHELRRQVSAIGVGVGTVLLDNPRLTVRTAPDGDVRDIRQPLRVIFDSHLRTPARARLLGEPGATVIYCTESEYEQCTEERTALEQLPNVHVVPVAAAADGRVSLRAALEDLARRGFTSLLVEGGSGIATALLSDRLVDKVVYYLSPKLLGNGLPALSGPTPDTMDDGIALRDVSWTPVGTDLRVEGYPVYPDEKRG